MSIVKGGSCDGWTLYGRSHELWYDLGTMELSSGSGGKKLSISPAMDIDALLTYPNVDGSLEWDDHITVYDPACRERKEDAPAHRNSGRWLEGDWTEDQYRVNYVNTSAFQLRTPIQNCRDLKVMIDVDRKHNTSCKDWSVYTWDGDSWIEIGDIYMPSGKGGAEAEIHLDTSMWIEYIIVVPEVNGSYSWECAIAVYDLN